MVRALVFRLIAPMASWGGTAVGESRHSGLHPSRSAVLGLLAAALGLRRDNDEGHAALAAQCRLATKVLSAGFPLRDFQTIQIAPELRKLRYRTRRQELTWPERSKLGTLLSSREYRTDAYAVVAVVMAHGSVESYTLDDLNAALVRPTFPLYLGRRSCPLGAPLAASVVEFSSLKAGLDSFDSDPLQEWTGLYDQTHGGGERYALSEVMALRRQWHYYWDTRLGSNGLDPSIAPSLTLTHHDEPLSRQRWQFASREEYLHMETPQ